MCGACVQRVYMGTFRLPELCNATSPGFIILDGCSVEHQGTEDVNADKLPLLRKCSSVASNVPKLAEDRDASLDTILENSLYWTFDKGLVRAEALCMHGSAQRRWSMSGVVKLSSANVRSTTTLPLFQSPHHQQTFHLFPYHLLFSVY